MSLLFRTFLMLQLLATTLSATAQIDCRCCKMRAEGQVLFDKGRYTEAKNKWKSAKELSDAKEKCKDLDRLIAKPIPKPPTKPESTKQEPAKPKPTKKPPVKIKKPFTFKYPMVKVEGGTFPMGSLPNEGGRDDDECQHSVSVDSFYMGKYEVTQAKWKAVMGNNPSHFKGCDDCPVENVSWNDIQEFIKKLNAATGKKYRLPTEAEWEYAARGGKSISNTYFSYSGSNNLDSVAWDGGNSDSKTHSVGTKRPNQLGLYDMTGNVWEWCQDVYQAYPCDSKSRGKGTTRCLRGGSCGADFIWNLRVSSRSGGHPSYRHNLVGFRLAKD